MKIKEYPNGSREYWLGSVFVRIEAPNPFGVGRTWSVEMSDATSNRSWESVKTWRRGKKWALDRSEEGWAWVEVKPADKS